MQTVQKTGDSPGAVLGEDVDAPVVAQRQVPWFRQYRIPWRFRSCSLVNRRRCPCYAGSQLRFIDKGLHCLMVDFAAFLRHLHSVRMSAHFSALDDEEFVVIEGSE